MTADADCVKNGRDDSPTDQVQCGADDSSRSANRTDSPGNRTVAVALPVPGNAKRIQMPIAAYFTRSILPQAMGNVTLAGIGPSDATLDGRWVLSGTPWM